MHYKFKTLEWWTISIWFLIFALISALIILSRPIPPINMIIVIAGLCLMFYTTIIEDELFPPKPEGDEEQ